MADIKREIVRIDSRTASDNGATITIWTNDDLPTTILFTAVVKSALQDWSVGKMGSEEFLEFITTVNADAKKTISNVITSKLTAVNKHIKLDGMRLYYDCDDFEKVFLDPVLVGRMNSLLSTKGISDTDFISYANFVERLYGNQTEAIRNQIVSWLTVQKWLTFSEAGYLIGYRGGQINQETGIAEAIHVGPGVVNGIAYAAGPATHLPNPDDGIVEVPRSRVVFDPEQGCGFGLHVGTFDYAYSWARDVIMRVEVDPADICSVPFDSGCQKIRCCRFHVLDHIVLDKTDQDDKVRNEIKEKWGETITYHEPGNNSADDYDEDLYSGCDVCEHDCPNCAYADECYDYGAFGNDNEDEDENGDDADGDIDESESFDSDTLASAFDSLPVTGAEPEPKPEPPLQAGVDSSPYFFYGGCGVDCSFCPFRCRCAYSGRYPQQG